MDYRKLFISFFGTGSLAKYPQLSAIGLAALIGTAIYETLGVQTLFTLAIAVAIVGTFETGKYLNEYPQNRSIVSIDKAAGVWLSMMIALGTSHTANIPCMECITIVISVASYTLFIIWKPSTIGWIEKNFKSGAGMMGSSIISGFAGGFLSIVILMGLQMITGKV